MVFAGLSCISYHVTKYTVGLQCFSSVWGYLSWGHHRAPARRAALRTCSLPVLGAQARDLGVGRPALPQKAPGKGFQHTPKVPSAFPVVSAVSSPPLL